MMAHRGASSSGMQLSRPRGQDAALSGAQRSARSLRCGHRTLIGTCPQPRLGASLSLGRRGAFAGAPNATAAASAAAAPQQAATTKAPVNSAAPASSPWSASPHVHVVGVEEAEELYLSLVQRTNEQHVLMVLYAPWCPHCTSMEPEVAKLAAGLAHEKSLVVVALNADPPAARYFAKEVLGVSALPSVVLFPRESRTFYKYRGSGRDAQSLLKFLNMVCNQSTDTVWALDPAVAGAAALTGSAASRPATALLLPGRAPRHQAAPHAGWAAAALGAAGLAVLAKYLYGRSRHAAAVDAVAAASPSPETLESGGVSTPGPPTPANLARGTRQLGGQIDQVMGRMGGLILKLAGARVSLGVMEAQIALLSATAGDAATTKGPASPPAQQLGDGAARQGGAVALLEAPAVAAVVAAPVVEAVATAVEQQAARVRSRDEEEEDDDNGQAGGGGGAGAAAGPSAAAVASDAAAAAAALQRLAEAEAAAPVLAAAAPALAAVEAAASVLVPEVLAAPSSDESAVAAEALAAEAAAAEKQQAALAAEALELERQELLRQQEMLLAMSGDVAVSAPLPGQAVEAALTGEHLVLPEDALSTAELLALLDQEGGDVDKVVQALLARNLPLESSPSSPGGALPPAAGSAA